MKKVISIIFISSFLIPYSLFSQTWQTYDSLRVVYQEKQSYDTALVYAEKALQLVKEKVGVNDTLYANMLQNIGETYDFLNDYDKTIDFFLQEKDIIAKIQGKRSPKYAEVLNNLGYFYLEVSNFQIAEQYILESTKIYKEVLGEKHPDYASSLNNLSYVYEAMGNYEKTEPLIIQVMQIRKIALGVEHPVYINSLYHLATFYEETGNYKKAEPFYVQAYQIRKKVLGEDHPDYALSLNSLAGIYYYLGLYEKAEPLYVQAMQNTKKGLDEVPYAGSLNNLAALYHAIGNYEKEEPLLVEALKILKKTLGEESPDYASSLNNLAALYDDIGNYEKAEPFYIQASQIRKKVLGEDHPDYALSLNSLAVFYNNLGDYEKAEPLYVQAIQILQKTLGEDHPEYAGPLNNLASLYKDMGNYEKSEPLFVQALQSRKKVLGEDHPYYAQSLNNLATLYETMGNYEKAEPLCLNYINIINRKINQNFSFLSEREKELYFKTITNNIQSFYSFSLQRKIENSEITKIVFNNVIKNKGLLLKSSTAMRSSILNNNDSLLIAKYKKWIDLKKDVSNLYSTEILKRTKNIEELEQQANTIEKQLVKETYIFSDLEKLQNLTWESVKNSLKPNEAAVEFIQFKSESSTKDSVIAKEERPKQSTSKDEIASTTSRKDENIVYCALIITQQSKQPEMIQLFEEKQILKILNSASGNNLNQVNNVYGTNLKVNESLYKLIWQPLEKYLEGVKTVYYSPDGILHKVSFAAIGNSKNIYLCDHVNLQQVSSTGKVAMPENALIDKNLTACIIGGVDYSTDSLKNALWQYLPGTLTETNAIKTKLLKNNITTKTYSGKEATELSFKNIYSIEGIRPEILHIATHGFFYPDPEQIQKEQSKEKVEEGAVAFRGGNSGFGLWQFVKNKNPLMRSGVVLAGANKVWSEPYAGTDNEGVLTAQEVTQLDMTKTKLVVLSACETGLGDIKGSEGVYGLQRAFKMAGVKFIVMSLWQVPDKETVEFMETFYTKLLKDKNIRLAFSETQKEMRNKYDPYYWGAFVLIE